MLVASLDGQRVEAESALRGAAHVCPQCEEAVVLKRGRKVIAHFAHKPPTDCTWARGETRAHMRAKKLLYESLVQRQLDASLEQHLTFLSGDRRADVFVRRDKGPSIAIELQHSTISLGELEARAWSYARAGITQLWIPFLRADVIADGDIGPDEDTDVVIPRYSLRPYEHWIAGFHCGDLWLYDPIREGLWRARVKSHLLYKNETSWFEAGGYENYGGGYTYPSKLWNDLHLCGPYPLSTLRIRRCAGPYGPRPRGYRYPLGPIARLMPLYERG